MHVSRLQEIVKLVIVKTSLQSNPAIVKQSDDFFSVQSYSEILRDWWDFLHFTIAVFDVIHS